MAKQSLSSCKSQGNPLKLWEEVALSRGWTFERPLPAEMIIDIEDLECPLHVITSWYEHDGYLEIMGIFDILIPERKKLSVFEILSSLSVGMRLGSIVLCPSYERPLFRHAFFVGRKGEIILEQILEAVEELMLAGEKLAQALQLVCVEGRSSQDAMFAAFMDVAGEA